MTVVLDGRRVFAAVIAATLCACVTTHPANPALDAFPAGIVGTTDVTYYDIHGRSAGELVAEMRRLGPKTAIGQIYFGETQSPMRWEWRTKSDGPNCTLTRVRVFVRSDITLPRWTPPSDTVSGLLAQWNGFLAGLERHEIGHKDISARAARDIQRRLEAVSTFCSSLQSEVARTTDGIIARLRQEQEEYDRVTRHGATQGAVFQLRGAPMTPARP